MVAVKIQKHPNIFKRVGMLLNVNKKKILFCGRSQIEAFSTFSKHFFSFFISSSATIHYYGAAFTLEQQQYCLGVKCKIII